MSWCPVKNLNAGILSYNKFTRKCFPPEIIPQANKLLKKAPWKAVSSELRATAPWSRKLTRLKKYSDRWA